MKVGLTKGTFKPTFTFWTAINKTSPTIDEMKRYMSVEAYYGKFNANAPLDKLYNTT